MFRNQLTALFTHERIITTVAKAKDLRPLAERIVTLARKDTLHGRREVLRWVPDKEVVQRLFDDVAPRFAGRPGGYTRILRLGRRHGDGAELAIIEFVDYEPGQGEDGGGERAKKGSLMDRAKGMFGGRSADTDEAADEIETAAAEDEVEAAPEEPAEEKPKKAKASKKAKPADEETAAEPKAEAEEPQEAAADTTEAAEPQEAEAPDADDVEAEPAADDDDEKKDAK
jgi:large subunit ribosomal protein L17